MKGYRGTAQASKPRAARAVAGAKGLGAAEVVAAEVAGAPGTEATGGMTSDLRVTSGQMTFQETHCPQG